MQNVIEIWTEIRHQEKETGYTQSVCLCFLTYSPGQCLAISSLRIMGERRTFVPRGIGTRHESNKE